MRSARISVQPLGATNTSRMAVVLAGVDLGALDPVDHCAGLVDVHPDVQEDERVVPAHHLRGDRSRRWTGRTPRP